MVDLRREVLRKDNEAFRRWGPRIFAAIALMALILALPSSVPAWPVWRAVGFPLEILPLFAALLLLSGRWFSIFRLVLMALLGAILLLKLADIGTHQAFQRPFNPYLDVRLLNDGWHLLRNTVGKKEALAIVCAAMMIYVLFVALLYWALGAFKLITPFSRRRAAKLALIVFGLGVAVIAGEGEKGHGFGMQVDMVPSLVRRVAMLRESAADLRAFEAELAHDDAERGAQLSGLAGADVVVIFIESYGRSAIADPRYSGTVRSRLATVEQQIGRQGLKARSGWLQSPTVGGLSWLAHGTLLSGLWVDNQARYDRMIVSDRPSLNRIFRQAGWQTVAVMPAITRAWPEAGYFGYDRIHASGDLGYAGRPFNWVTMPDQFTLSAFEGLERTPRQRPIMAEIALISSHAPWTPVPRLVEWSDIGDGKIFDTQAQAGDPPAVVWADADRVRSQYLASIDYTLETLGSYLARFGDNTLFILVGDHQPAAIVTGEDASRDVPIHFVSKNAGIVDQVASWTSPGMLPSAETRTVRMDRFREVFLRSFR